MVYRPISEYGIIGNDNRIALIDTDGSIDWCCFPDIASPSVFGRLLDAEAGGHFAIRPTATYESTQEYLDATNVLQTTFETSSGRATLIDFMPVADEDRPNRYQHSILRQLHCETGSLTVEVEFRPQFDYGRGTTVVSQSDRGFVARHHSATDIPETDHEQISEQSGSSGDEGEMLTLQCAGMADMVDTHDRAVGTKLVTAGESLWFVLQYNHFRPLPPAKCRRAKAETVAYWSSWSEPVANTAKRLVGEQDWFEQVLRSALVLKLLINEQTGAIYAAATTSLPEEYGNDRNWDYRYNWIRDAKFTIQALYNLGQTTEAKQYFEWFREISHDDPDSIQPVYGTDGDRELPEMTLDHLSGYRYSTPVRIGNAASEQRQLDTYGTIVQALYETLLHGEQIEEEDWESICGLIDHVCDVWDERDPGLWEFRTDPRHYVHSKLLCWVALDRGIELAENQDSDIDVADWKTHREDIRTAIEEQGYSDAAECFVQHFETDETFDAACLLIPIYGFLPPDDPRVENTIEKLMDELMTEDGLMHRTAGRGTPDEGKGTFLFCTFWLIDALVIADRLEEAREIFTTVLDHLSTPALLPERLDPDTGEYLGNYPQAFSHIGLINSAIYLCSKRSDVSLEHDPQQSSDVQSLFRS